MFRFSVCLAVLIGVLVFSTVQAGPMAHWKFDDGSGNTALDSIDTPGGGENDGDLTNSPAWVGGKIGTGALRFSNDDSSYVNCGTDPSLAVAENEDFTYAFWANVSSRTPPGPTYWAWLLGQNGEGNLVIAYSGSRVRITMGGWFDDTINVAVDPQNNQWDHMALTRSNNDDVKFYWNGVEADTGTNNVAIGVNQPLVIGTKTTLVSDRRLNGMMDDVGIWHETVSGREIAAIAGLGDFAGVDLNSSQIDDVLALSAVGQWAMAGGMIWNYTETFPDEGSRALGEHFVGDNGWKYIILDGSPGNFSGAVWIPEPSTLVLFALGGLWLLLWRRRRSGW